MGIIKNKGLLDYDDLGLPIQEESNEVTFIVLGDNLTVQKKQNPDKGIKGTIITYTLIITNIDSESSVRLVKVSDKLNTRLEFVENSITVDGESVEGDICEGIVIDTIAPAQVVTVTFEAKVLSRKN